MKDVYEVLSEGRARHDWRYTVNTVDPDFDIQSVIEFADRTKSEDDLYGLSIVEFDDEFDARAWLKGRL